MATTLNKGRLFWLGVLALFTAASSLAIRGAIASGLKAEWIDPIAPLEAGELVAGTLAAAFLSFSITLFVANSNDPSMRLYARLGFEPVKETELYLQMIRRPR